MPDEPPLPGGWLPPRAPGAGPAPRFDAAEEAGSHVEAAPRFAPPSAGASAPARPAEAAPGAAGPPTFVRPGAPAPGGPRGGTDPLAVASVLLGSAGLAILVVSLGLGFFLALPCSAAGWLLATRARGRIAAGGSPGGEGAARAGRLLGLVGIGAAVLAMVVWVALILSGFSLDAFQRDLERELDRRREPSAQSAIFPDPFATGAVEGGAPPGSDGSTRRAPGHHPTPIPEGAA